MATIEMVVTAQEPDGTERKARLVEEGHFAHDVRVELDRARGVGSGKLAYPPMASLHEGYSVILEEVDEFWDIVKLKPSLRNFGDLYKELVQIAAMAQRTAEDLKLKEKSLVQDGILDPHEVDLEGDPDVGGKTTLFLAPKEDAITEASCFGGG